MSFQSIAKSYLKSLQQKVIEAQQTGQFTPELSYRPTLHIFFCSLVNFINKEIKIVHEPRNQEREGHPDWRFYNSSTMGVYGYVEAKSVNQKDNIPISIYMEQINKYLNLGLNLILTDGIEFIFFYPNKENYKRIYLIDKPICSDQWNSLEIKYELESEFRKFFTSEKFRVVSEEQIIKEVAKRAILLSQNIKKLTELEIGSGLTENENKAIEVLHNIKPVLEKHHDIRLRSSDAFGDFIAQILIFGLLYAHRVIDVKNRNPSEIYKILKNFWINSSYKFYTSKLITFRGLIDILEVELNSLGLIGTWYQDSCLLLSHIRLKENQKKNPDYHKLYEKFLEVYDPKAKFDFGVFYTPIQLSKFTVSLTEAIIKSELGNNSSLFQRGNKLIDPCCGTGTFLEQLIIKGGIKNNLPIIIGFEILPAPYALANYRIYMEKKDEQYPKNLYILLTDTLSDELEKNSDDIPRNLIAKEQELARNLSRPPITLVIGNPPSSDSSRKQSSYNQKIINKLLDDFRPEKSELTDRQNIQKQVGNEFMKFLRWSLKKLEDSNPAILSFILPSSFIEHSSYEYARKFLLTQFDKIWILELDKDGRTGIRSSSLFNTQQGRVLIIGLNKSGEKNKICESLQYFSITNMSKIEKLDFLNKERKNQIYLSIFKQISFDPDNYKMCPIPQFNKGLYNKFWPVYPERKTPQNGESYIFARHCSGIKLAPSGMFVHSDKKLLRRRTREIADTEISIDEIKKRWFSNQDKPLANSKFNFDVRRKINEGINSSFDNVYSYAYRPFLNIYSFIYEPVFEKLAKIGGGGTRARPEVLNAFYDKDVMGITIAPSPKDIGEKLHRFASFCWFHGDNDLCKRGNAHIFCNYFPIYKSTKKGRKEKSWDSIPKLNINPVLLNKISDMINDSLKNTANKIVFYVYAILCSDLFLDEFEGALFSYADRKNRPRIPFPNDKGSFNRITEIGKKLAMLEKTTDDIEISKEYKKFESLYSEPFRLFTYKINADEEKLDLKDENKQAILTIRPISRYILNFEVSGYVVIKQWLKYHSHRYSRKTFTRNEFNELLQLFQRISDQLELIKDLDTEVELLISGKIKLL